MSSQIVPRRTGVIIKRTKKSSPRRMEQRVFRMIYEMACEMDYVEKTSTFIRWAEEIIRPICLVRLPDINMYFSERLNDRINDLISLQIRVEECVNGFRDVFERYECYPLSEKEMKKKLANIMGQFNRKLITLKQFT